MTREAEIQGSESVKRKIVVFVPYKDMLGKQRKNLNLSRKIAVFVPTK
jgi:hypothetical protein